MPDINTSITSNSIRAVFDGTAAEGLSHNQLGGLQGGAANQYYHITQSQNSILAGGANGTFTTADLKTVTVENGIITGIS